MGVATGDQQIVADYIYPLQPVTAMVYCIAPSPHSIDVTLEDLSPSDDAIIAALNYMMLVEGEPGGTLYPSQFYEAINAIPGIDHFVIASPADAVNLPGGALPVMGRLIVH